MVAEALEVGAEAAVGLAEVAEVEVEAVGLAEGEVEEEEEGAAGVVARPRS